MIVGKRLLRFSNLLVWLVSLGAGAFLPVSTALAASRDDGYSLTLTESTSSMYYGDVDPTFQAFLTVPADEPPLRTSSITMAVDGAFAYGGDLTGSAPNYTLTMSSTSVWGFKPGMHTIQARYLSIPLDAYIYSQQLTFTVYKGNATLLCNIMISPSVYDTNIYPADASWEMNFLTHNSYTGGNFDVDAQNATYTLIFVGAQTFTYPNIKPTDVNHIDAFITSPSAPGNYTMRCLFNGTSLFSPTETDKSVTLQSTSSAPSPTPTATSVSQQPGPGSTPTASGTHPQPGSTATPTGTSTATTTTSATATATAPATSNLAPTNTPPPSSSNPNTGVLWMLAAVVVCAGAGGLGLLFWRKRRPPVSQSSTAASE